MPYPKGKPFSAEHRAKISAANKKRIYKPLSDEHKAKLAASQRGVKDGPLSAEHRAAIGRGQEGRTTSAQTRELLSQRQKQAWQNDPDHKKKTHTEEARKKRSASFTKLRTGRKATEAEVTANQEAQQRLWQSYSPEEWEARTAKLRPKKARFVNTSIERAVSAALTELGIEHKHNARLGRYQIDIYIPAIRLVIECDGTYWHSKPEQIEKDRLKDTWLRDQGYHVARLTEKAINADAKAATLSALASRGCD